MNCLLRYMHSLFVKIRCDSACFSLYILLYLTSGMNTCKLDCLISLDKHDSIEHGMAELVRDTNSTIASDGKAVWVRAQIQTDTYLSCKFPVLGRTKRENACGHRRVSTAPVFSSPPAISPPFLFYTYAITENCTKNRGTRAAKPESKTRYRSLGLLWISGIGVEAGVGPCKNGGSDSGQILRMLLGIYL